MPESTKEMKLFERGDDPVFTAQVIGKRYRNRCESRKGSSPSFLIPRALLGLLVENKNTADTLLTIAHSSADPLWLTLSIFSKLQFVAT